MDNSDVLQRNADGELEVRVVNGTEKADAPANYDDVFTVNSEGKRALRVVGAGGGGGSGGLETVSHDETLSGNGTTNSPLSVVNPVPSDGTTGQVLTKTADGIEWADAATGDVISVNGVQPVNGDVEITGDNITATVGEEEATITQHLTTLQQSINGKQGALTTEQLAAVNSGITSAKVANYDAYADEISTAQSTAEKADGAAEVAQQTANLAGQNAAQALTQLAGKVNIAQGAENAGKVMTVGADGNLAPADAPGAGFPQDSDYVEVVYTGDDVSGPYLGAFNINLGSLSDGVYEFYVKTKSIELSGFAKHYFRITIENGELKTTFPDTYYTIAFSPEEIGTQQVWSGINWASQDLLGFPYYYAKVGNDFHLEAQTSSPYQPGSLSWNNITQNSVVGYVSKIRNIATKELFTPVVTLVTEMTSGYNPVNIGSNPFFTPIPAIPNLSAGTFPIYTNISSSTKSFEINMANILLPGNYQSGQGMELNSFPIRVRFNTYSQNTPEDFFYLDVYFGRDGIEVNKLETGGIFSGTTVGLYSDMNSAEGLHIVFKKESGFGSASGADVVFFTSYIYYGASLNNRIYNASFYEDIPEFYSLITELPAPKPNAVATLLYYDSTQAPDHSHAMSGVSLDDYGLAGYEVYSNGYVRQWGQDSTSTGTTLVTLPISYTAATTVSMSFFVSVTEVAAAPTGQISAIPVAANQFQVDKPSAICNWETSGYITLS